MLKTSNFLIPSYTLLINTMLLRFFLFTLVLGITSIQTVVGQGLIAVKGGSRNAVFTDVKSAYNYAQAGDYIYLPEGSFYFESIRIQKEVHFVGVGYNPRFAGASGITTIDGDITFDTGGDGASITGLYITGTVSIGNGTLKNITVRRCWIAVSVWMGGDNHDNIVLTESIVGGEVVAIDGRNTNKYVNNCILVRVRGSERVDKIILKNNIFLTTANADIRHINSINVGLVENNIFLNQRSTTTGIGESLVFRNNVFRAVRQDVEGDVQEGNQFEIASEQIFMNVADLSAFKPSFDYHLKPNSPARMDTETNEQDDAGIYGGINPWKDGGLPPNPHIEVNNTAYSATGNKLQLNMRVNAQSK